MKSNTELSGRIKELLNLHFYPSIKQDRRNKPPYFEVDFGSNFTVTFSILKKLSDFFGTEKIDVNNYTESGGGCESCYYESAAIKIQVYEATKNLPKDC